MTRSYLAVFEKAAEDNWGAFTLDVPGAVGAGDSLEEARQSLLAGIDIQLEDLGERGLDAPLATSTTVDFDEFDPEHTNLQYVIEWLTVELPAVGSQTRENAQQAA